MTQKETENALIGLYRMADDKDTVIRFVEVLDETGEDDYDEAALIKFAFGGKGEEPTEESSAVYYPGADIVFTTTDWQSAAYPTSLEDVPRFEWRSFYGRGYVLDGLPRLFGEANGMLNEDLSERLHEARLERGLTLKDLGNKSGVNFATIAKIEGGKISPTVTTVNKMLLPMGKMLDVVDLYVPVATDRFGSYREVMGERLKAFRLERGLDVLDVAAKGGISVNQVYAIESGEEAYSIDTFLGYVSGSDLYIFFSTKTEGESLDDMARKGVENDPERNQQHD